MSITKQILKVQEIKKSLPLYSCAAIHLTLSFHLYSLSHSAVQTWTGLSSRSERPSHLESRRDRNSRRDGKQGETTNACPSDVYDHGGGGGDGELVSYVLRAMPDCLWPAAFINSGVYAHSSSPAQPHRICLSRCNRCGDVNFAWEPEPELSSHETTTSLSRTCARRVFVKMTAHRRLRNDRCTCPYLFENYSNLLYYTIERVGVY